MRVSAGLGSFQGLEGRILPASSAFWRVQAFLGLWPQRASLSSVLTWPPLRVCPLLLGRPSWGIRATLHLHLR